MGKKVTSTLSVNKHKEKRQARKEEQKKIAANMAIITAAKKNFEEVMKASEDLFEYGNRDMQFKITYHRVSDLDKDTTDWIFELTRTNMKRYYEDCSWGWDEKKKNSEMMEDEALYLVARLADGRPVAFAHFRFDMDYEDPVLYCYELQVERTSRRRGIGARLMRVLDRSVAAAHVSFVRLTALKHNPSAMTFFKVKGYTIDETSPELEEAAHYEILSKTRGACILSEVEAKKIEAARSNSTINETAPTEEKSLTGQVSDVGKKLEDVSLQK